MTDMKIMILDLDSLEMVTGGIGESDSTLLLDNVVGTEYEDELYNAVICLGRPCPTNDAILVVLKRGYGNIFTEKALKDFIEYAMYKFYHID